MRLRGVSAGRTGTAIGTAAVVRVMSGVPLPPEIPPRILKERASGRNSELPDVIVVAEEFRNALAISGAISWANVVGVAAVNSEMNPLPAPFPAVVGLSNLLEVVADDMLLLLDASAGILLADPDPVAIAQYQAEAEHLAPKRRFFLEDAHLPATTLDGHTVQVIARIQSLDDARLAAADGADIFYAPIDEQADNGFTMPAGFLIPSEADEATLRLFLFELLEATSGKPLIISDFYSLPAAIVLDVAAQTDLTVAIYPNEDFGGAVIAQLRAELETALEESETAGQMPRLAIDFVMLNEEDIKKIAPAFKNGAKCMIVSLEIVHSFLSEILPYVDAFVAQAASNLLPIYLLATEWDAMDETLETSIRYAAGTRADGLIVQADEVSKAKEIIRGLRFEECRELVLRQMS